VAWRARSKDKFFDRINKINTVGRQTEFRHEEHEGHEGHDRAECWLSFFLLENLYQQSG
jgi:hypothetical protein